MLKELNITDRNKIECPLKQILIVYMDFVYRLKID